MRYLGLLGAFFKVSLMADLEYRFNVVLRIFTDIIWYTVQFSFLAVLVTHFQQIEEWDLASTRVFMGTLFLVDALWMVMFSENLEQISSKVRNGDLDMLLSKPIDSQFMMSFQKMNTPYLVNVFLTSGFLFWSLWQVQGGGAIGRLLWLALGVPSGLAVTYSCKIFFSALGIIFVNADSVGYVWFQLYKVGARPDSFYPRWLRYIIFSLIPVGLIASVPARLVLNIYDPWMIFGLPLMALSLLYLTYRFWGYSLRHYASASS